jgi:hypothetical protein
MSTVTYFITKSGILVSDGAALTAAIEQKLITSTQSGEVLKISITQVENAAPIIETNNDINDYIGYYKNWQADDLNTNVRDAFANTLGSLAGVGALSISGNPLAALAVDQAFSDIFTEAYNRASEWSRDQDWTSILNEFQQTQREFTD